MNVVKQIARTKLGMCKFEANNRFESVQQGSVRERERGTIWKQYR